MKIRIGAIVAITALIFALGTSAKDMPARPAEAERPVDLVICLDTSGSMQGLIEAAKQKLWDIVNELAKAQPKPHLRVALYAYGTPNYGVESGYVKKLVDLTDDLDKVFTELTPLRTNGGDEYVARVVRTATLDQPWSADKSALKIIVVAGNEPATQDPKFKTADVCKETITKGIIVNTIYCGAPTNPEAEGWREVARMADGQFASIDHQNGIIIVSTPFDQKLAELSAAINKTYVGYGAMAAEGQQMQREADAASAQLGQANAAARAAAKGSSQYRNERWDLVDAKNQKDFDLSKVKDEELPEDMRKMTLEERKAHLEKLEKERETIQNEIRDLSAKRQQFINDEIKKGGQSTDKAFDAAMLKALREQAQKKGFKFGE